MKKNCNENNPAGEKESRRIDELAELRERKAREASERAYRETLAKLEAEERERERAERERAEARQRSQEEAAREAMTERDKWLDTYRTIKDTIKNLDAMASDTGRFMVKFYYASLDKELLRARDGLQSTLHSCIKEMGTRGIAAD